MSASLRFLAVAVLAWAGVRAATLGIIPGAEIFAPAEAEAFAPAEAEAEPPPIVPTEFPPLPPVAYANVPAYLPPPQATLVPVYYYYPVQASAPRPLPPQPAAYAAAVPQAEPSFYSTIPGLEDWDLASIATSFPERRSSAPTPSIGVPPAALTPGKLDRIQLSAWALLRNRSGSGSLASGGTLGGSQAGARLTYKFDRRFAASLRSSSPVGGSRGGEVAAGVRFTPIPSLPVSITAERRQRIGKMGTGRNAFALFAEGGLYQVPLPYHLSLDAYAQAGIVGLNNRDLFADGAFTVMRPLYGPVSVGFGTWAGAQPGLYRVDAGPRLSMRVRGNMRVDLDWRQRLVGEANPGSGPALTLAADF